MKNKKTVPERTPKKKREEKERRYLQNRAEIISFFTRLLILVVFLFVAFGVIFGVTPVKNNDMNPVLSAGDLILYYRMDKDISSGDVVVYRADGSQYVGRVVAGNGDKVEITDDGVLKINDSTVVEADIYYSTYPYDSDVTYPLTLGEDEYFILADYREGGTDSRYFGAIEAADIKGVLLAALRRDGL